MADFKWPEDVTQHQMEAVSAIVWVLHDHGPVIDESGRATKLLEDLLEERGTPVEQLSKVLGQMDASTPQARYGSLIRRKKSQTRTSRIELVKNRTLPPNLFEAPEQEEEEIEELVTEPEYEDAEIYVDDIGDIELVPDAPDTSTDLVPMDDVQITTVDRLLYAQSAIGDAIAQITEEDLDRRRENMAEQFELVERLVRENESLRAETREQQRQIRQLNRALQQTSRR